MDRSPSLGSEAFVCPHCHAFTQQSWFSLYANAADGPPTTWDAGRLKEREEELEEASASDQKDILRYIKSARSAVEGRLPGLFRLDGNDQKYYSHRFWNLNVARCFVCKKESVWLADRIIFPQGLADVDLPNEDLPGDIADDYLEAAAVVVSSPRSAAALLRLSIQKLCSHLLEKPGDINSMIGELVQLGLPARVQKALDTVRVVGNEALHPGTMDLRDDRGTALQLFKLVNVIADAMISQPKHIDAIYAALPEAKLQGIASRDAKKTD